MSPIKEMYGALRIFNNDGKKRMAVLDGHRIFLDEVADFDPLSPTVLHGQIITPDELVAYIQQHKSRIEIEQACCFLSECGITVLYADGTHDEVTPPEFDEEPSGLEEEAVRHELNQRLNKFFHGDPQCHEM